MIPACLTSLILLWAVGCVSVPPQIAVLHEKELGIIKELQKTHLAMVDAYVNQKISDFEQFYFKVYGPSYRTTWEANFKSVRGRDYDPDKDFPIFYEDLVAEYIEVIEPMESQRSELHDAIGGKYRLAISAHESIGTWINSVEALNNAQREAVDSLLGGIKPGLSLDSLEEAFGRAKDVATAKLGKLTGSDDGE